MSTSSHRVEMYLSAEEFKDFERMRKSLKLTKSAYCRLQNGFDENIRPGAPKGNKNAAKKKRKREDGTSS